MAENKNNKFQELVLTEQLNSNVDSNFTVISQIQGGICRGIAIYNDTIAIFSFGTTLKFYNISNKNSIFELAELPLKGYIKHMVLFDCNIYILSYMGGTYLQIIDINNILEPKEISSLSVSGQFPRLSYNDQTIYISDDNNNKIHIIDVSNPEHPSELAYIKTNASPKDVVSVGNYLYSAVYGYGLHITDISIRNNPKEIGYFDTKSSQKCITYSDSCIILGTSYGVEIFNISNPEYPIKLSEVNTENAVYDIRFVDSTLYIAVVNEGIKSFNISNKSYPQELSSIKIPNHIYMFYADKDYLYIPNHYFGFRIIDFTNPKEPFEIINVNEVFNAQEVAIKNDIVYVASYYGLHIINYEDEQNPIQIGYSPDTRGRSIALKDTFVFILNGGSSKLDIFSISNPKYPQKLKSQDIPGWYFGNIYIENDYAFVASNYGLQLIDISNPLNPIILDSYKSKGWIEQVYADEQNIFTLDDVGYFTILNIENGDSLKEMAQFFLNGIRSFDLKDYYLLVADHNRGLTIYSITNNENIVFVSSLPYLKKAIKVKVHENYAYVVEEDLGLYSINISDINHPVVAGYFTKSQAKNVSILNDNILLSADGLYFLENNYISFIDDRNSVKSPIDFCVNHNYPNPFNPSTTIELILYKNGTLKVEIYDLLGKLVKKIFDGEKESGRYFLNWDGKNEFGKTASTGTYFIKVQFNENEIIKKAQLIK